MNLQKEINPDENHTFDGKIRYISNFRTNQQEWLVLSIM
jgi:hypothetical protein